MHLILRAHEQMSHRGVPREVVAEGLHKDLDKLEGNNKSLFAVVMANTSSSVHARIKPSEPVDKVHDSQDKYSENYWADAI